MGQTIVLTGMVLSAAPIGEYDKRITILTRERGKISAFARGARRQGSQLVAAANPFAFGEFEAYEGRSSYTVVKASISNYFRGLLEDFEAVYYGFYFLEVADYYCRENADGLHMLKLLYQSLRALEHPKLPNRLVRCIFELKTLVVNGEYPNFFSCMGCGKEEGLACFDVGRRGMLCAGCGGRAAGWELPGGRTATDRKGEAGSPAGTAVFFVDASTLYALQYITAARIEKLYTFAVSGEVLDAMEHLLREYGKRYGERSFKSLKILEESVEIKPGK